MKDTISRQAAIDALIEYFKRSPTTAIRAAGVIENLPSAEIEGYAKIPDGGIEDLSDGFHTFRQLYYQRMILFATMVKQNREKAWKSLRHEDGELCFDGGWFIVGIDTPEGSYTYHYEVNHFNMFDCKELERGKHWDGHTEKDVVRLLSLPSAEPEQQHGKVFKGIVVEYPSYSTYPERKGKPYFSIKYTENGQEFIGFGTYKPEVLSEYLKEYFMSYRVIETKIGRSRGIEI